MVYSNLYLLLNNQILEIKNISTGMPLKIIPRYNSEPLVVFVKIMINKSENAFEYKLKSDAFAGC